MGLGVRGRVRAVRGGELAMPPAMPGAARLGDGAAKPVEELPVRRMPVTGGAAGSGELLPARAPAASGSWTSYTS